MRLALIQANKAYELDEIPVGTVITYNDIVIASTYNQREQTNDITAHAEILAIREASKYLKTWKLDNCVMYTTLEPCPMCASAIIQSRIKTLYFGASSTKFDNEISVFDMKSNHKVEITGDILGEESRKLLKNYFSKKRN
jgi:tRNA(adenine34) deaminase